MKEKVLRVIIGVGLAALFLAGCGGDSAVPKSIGEVTTPSGKFGIVGVETSDRFPLDCTSSDPGCQQARSGYKILIIWLHPQSDIDSITGGIALQKDASSAYITASDGSRTEGIGGGLISGKWFILFTPPASGSNFTLDWFDNPSIELGK